MQKIGEEGGSSGRDIIYANIFNGWYSSQSILNLLFGFGFAASLNLSNGKFAHNDWLELLSNFGLIGICVYLGLFIIGFKYVFYTKWTVEKRILIFTVLLIWLFTTFVSMSYTSEKGYIQSLLIAYLIGNKSTSLS